MKIIMYGTASCPDCAEAIEKLTAAKFEFDFRDITADLKNLKEFLSYRDNDQMFAPVIKSGGIGIPFFILKDQTRTFETDFLKSSD